MSLNSRELQLLQLGQQGLSIREIAERAAMTVGSVRTTLWQINKKLGVHSLRAAVLMAMREGLIESGCPWCKPKDAVIAEQDAVINELRDELMADTKQLIRYAGADR